MDFQRHEILSEGKKYFLFFHLCDHGLVFKLVRQSEKGFSTFYLQWDENGNAVKTLIMEKETIIDTQEFRKTLTEQMALGNLSFDPIFNFCEENLKEEWPLLIIQKELIMEEEKIDLILEYYPDFTMRLINREKIITYKGKSFDSGESDKKFTGSVILKKMMIGEFNCSNYIDKNKKHISGILKRIL